MAHAIGRASMKGEIDLTTGIVTFLGGMRNTGPCQFRRMLLCHAGLASFIINLRMQFLETFGSQICRKSTSMSRKCGR